MLIQKSQTTLWVDRPSVIDTFVGNTHSPTGKEPMKHDEYHFQCLIVKALSGAGVPVFSVPNHLLKSGLAETKREISAGFRKGAPDLIAGKDGKSYWLELKTEKGHQSIEQQCFQEIAEEFGAEYRVVRELDDIKDLIQ